MCWLHWRPAKRTASHTGSFCWNKHKPAVSGVVLLSPCVCSLTEKGKLSSLSGYSQKQRIPDPGTETLGFGKLCSLYMYRNTPSLYTEKHCYSCPSKSKPTPLPVLASKKCITAWAGSKKNDKTDHHTWESPQPIFCKLANLFFFLKEMNYYLSSWGC